MYLSSYINPSHACYMRIEKSFHHKFHFPTLSIFFSMWGILFNLRYTSYVKGKRICFQTALYWVFVLLFFRFQSRIHWFNWHRSTWIFSKYIKKQSQVKIKFIRFTLLLAYHNFPIYVFIIKLQYWNKIGDIWCTPETF